MLSLSQLTATITTLLEKQLDPSYWVCAEIASISTRSGNAYFELIETTESGQMLAKVRATCWSNTYTMLAPYFQQQTGLPLQTGMKILAQVEVLFHPIYSLSLNIVNIDPQFTLGEVLRARQATILRLQQEELWDLQRALIIPTLPLRIAVISSPQAAGYEDFISQLQASGFRFQCTLFPALMQGAEAPKTIIHALSSVSDNASCYDIVTILRGGGATTDLTCFDDYDLCRAATLCPLPILTGVGHTRDVSILDQVVHYSLKTPTAVASFLVDLLQQQFQTLIEWRKRLALTAERQVLIRRHRLQLLNQRILATSPERIFQMGYSRLTHQGKVVHSISDIHEGDIVITSLMDGEISSQIVTQS